MKQDILGSVHPIRVTHSVHTWTYTLLDRTVPSTGISIGPLALFYNGSGISKLCYTTTDTVHRYIIKMTSYPSAWTVFKQFSYMTIQC